MWNQNQYRGPRYGNPPILYRPSGQENQENEPFRAHPSAGRQVPRIESRYPSGVLRPYHQNQHAQHSHTAEEIAAEKTQRAEVHIQKQAESKAKRLAESAIWPKIEACYMPEAWRQKYRTDHAEPFFKSVKILQMMRRWSFEEAKETLLDILVKVTFIETNLTMNGPRTAEELFDNLQLAQDNEETIPFSSPEDLAAFCDSMPLNFHKAAGKRYRNTGVQGRRLVQELKRRLELGDVIDDDSLDQVMKDFCETIQVKPGLENFAKREAGLDYSSWWFLAKKIPGFQYDKKSGRLSLTPESVDSLPLNLPIFTDTINSSHPRKRDNSREIDTFTTYLCTWMTVRRMGMLINSEDLMGVRASFYNKYHTWAPETLYRAFNLTHGCIRPNLATGPVEVFSVEPTTICFLDNVCTGSSARSSHTDQRGPLNFRAANKNYLHQEEQIVPRKTEE